MGCRTIRFASRDSTSGTGWKFGFDGLALVEFALLLRHLQEFVSMQNTLTFSLHTTRVEVFVDQFLEVVSCGCCWSTSGDVSWLRSLTPHRLRHSY